MRHVKPLFYSYQVYKYFVYYPFLAISTTVQGSMAAIFSILFGPKVGTVMGIVWARLNSYVTPMFVTVYGKENVDKKQSYVVVGNHQSLFDIFVIYGWLPMDFRWVMKMQLRKVPFLGYSCYKIGHIFIDRSNPEVAIKTINEAKERIKNGTSVFFFPEGKRSETEDLLEFKKGAFKFALDMNLPVLPVSIVGTDKILPSNTTALFPGFAKLVIHEPIDIGGYNDENMSDLMDLAKQSIQKGLNDNR